MDKIKLKLSYLLLPFLGIFFATLPTANADIQVKEESFPKLVAVTPIDGAKNSDEIYIRTVRLIKALREEGFEVGAIQNNDDPVPGSEPYLLIGASIADPKYCLLSIISGRRLSEQRKLQFEYRQDRYKGAWKLNDDECATQWAKGVKQRVAEEWAKSN
jgi:hypothetical protein